MSYTINPSAEAVAAALESWAWIGVGDEQPILVTSFADAFFDRQGEVWFLDTLEGSFAKSHSTRQELDTALSSQAGKDHYFFAGFVDLAVQEGRELKPGQCYDFKLPPKVGGAIAYDNVEVCDFVVALNIRGQIHEQARNIPDGTKISKFVPKE